MRRMKTAGWCLVLVAAVVAIASIAGAQSASGDGPRYRNGNELVRPDDYREWMFLSSGLGMTYEAERVEEAGSGARPMRFQNVFVNRSAYAGFKETGEWPNGSIFILEIRQAVSEASINVAGSFQSDLLVLEAEVKDSRFEDGWAFYNFGPAGSMPDRGRAPAPRGGGAVRPVSHRAHRGRADLRPVLSDAAGDRAREGYLEAGLPGTCAVERNEVRSEAQGPGLMGDCPKRLDGEAFRGAGCVGPENRTVDTGPAQPAHPARTYNLRGGSPNRGGRG